MMLNIDEDGDSKDCEVVINERQVYCPGEKLTGAVKFQTSKVRYARRIDIKICGQAYVRWSESNQFETNEYINCERYVDESKTLLEFGKNNQLQRLLPGDNEYPFCFVLPPSHLPSSFNHGWHKKHYAAIRYWLRAYISFSDGEKFTVSREFYLKETMDLSKVLHLQEPLKMSVDEYVCWWCFKTGPVVLTMEINRTAYYPGDDIVITASIDTTLSSVSTGKVEAQLVQRVNYIANSDYVDKSSSKSDKSLQKEHWNMEKNLLLSASVGSRRQMNWDNVRIKVPKAFIPTISCSKCIGVSYFVQLRVYLRLSDDCLIRMPIVIVSKPRFNPTEGLTDITDDESSRTQDTDLEQL